MGEGSARIVDMYRSVEKGDDYTMGKSQENLFLKTQHLSRFTIRKRTIKPSTDYHLPRLVKDNLPL